MTRLLVLLLLLAWPAAARELPFATAAQVDLMLLLPPPPPAASPQREAELAEVLAAQQRRTPERAAQAIADARETVFDMFTPVLGPGFAAERLPLAAALFARLGVTEDAVVTPAKTGFNNPRPFVGHPEITPVLGRPDTGSYPSGHATRSTLEGLILIAMAPEWHDKLFARMQDYAESRLIGGVHVRSDLTAGMRAGTGIAAVLLNDPAFMAEFKPARAEIRQAFGLP